MSAQPLICRQPGVPDSSAMVSAYSSRIDKRERWRCTPRRKLIEKLGNTGAVVERFHDHVPLLASQSCIAAGWQRRLPSDRGWGFGAFTRRSIRTRVVRPPSNWPKHALAARRSVLTNEEFLATLFDGWMLLRMSFVQEGALLPAFLASNPTLIVTGDEVKRVRTFVSARGRWSWNALICQYERALPRQCNCTVLQTRSIMLHVSLHIQPTFLGHPERNCPRDVVCSLV